MYVEVEMSISYILYFFSILLLLHEKYVEIYETLIHGKED